MHWYPTPFWKGKDVYIIGGGPSLKKFDWALLRGVPTIGCNSAFRLGSEVCKICIFGDIKWWNTYKDALSQFDGLVVTNAPGLRDAEVGWLFTMRRRSSGLGSQTLGWNGNTGASAINLAIILGARRIFLLGFDMKLGTDKKPNWHEYRVEDAAESVYERFISGFDSVARDLKDRHPGREVINITDDSDLNCFPKVSLAEHFGVEVASGS